MDNSDSFNVSDDDAGDDNLVHVPYATAKATAKVLSVVSPLSQPTQARAETPQSSAAVPPASKEKKSPTLFYEKACKEQLEKDKRLIESMEEALRQEMKKCTFVPNIKKKSPPRGFNQFIEDQNYFIREKKANIETLRINREVSNMSHCQSVPKIEEYSKVLAKNVNEGNVHRRLYERAIISAAAKIEVPQKQVKTASSTVINESVKRLATTKAFGARRHSNDTWKALQNKAKPLETSHKLFCLKYESIIAKAFDDFTAEKLYKSDLDKLMDSMADVFPANLVDEVWELLEGEERQSVTKQAVYEVLLAILGISRNDKNTTTANRSPSPMNKIGAYNSKGLYELTESEKAYLYKNYGLYIRSANLSKRSTSNPALESVAEFPHSPKTNRNSSKLATLVRHKVVSIANAEGNITKNPTVEDVLLMQKDIYAQKVRNRKEAQEMEDKKHKFKPKINKRSMSPKAPIEHSILKWVERKKCEKMVPTDEYQYRKEAKEYTFHPKINTK